MSIIARPPDPSTTIDDQKQLIQEENQDAKNRSEPTAETARSGATSRVERDGDGHYVYRINREKLNTAKIPAVDYPSSDSLNSTSKIEDWLRVTEEIFSAPSKALRGEKVSVSSVDGGHSTSFRANHVTDVKRPALGLSGGVSESIPVVGSCFTLLDYRNTQAEKRKDIYNKYFSKTKIDTGLYKYKTVRSGDVLEVYEYEGLQKSQKGKEKNVKEKEEEKTEEKTEEQKQEIRKKSISRAKKLIKRTINANVGKWGDERPKFLTLTFKEDIKDFKTANYEFKKFHQRLSYSIGYTLKYTVVVQFQDGERKGGIEGGRGGVIHFHVVLYNMPFIPANELREDIWGQGFIKINAIDNVDNLGAYVVGGYMNKGFDDERYDGQKRFFSSRGLYDPLEVKSTSPIDLGEFTEDHKVFETSFENEYTGIIHYKQYNLKRRAGFAKKPMEYKE